MTLAQSLAKLFGNNGYLGLAFGAADVTGSAHNGVDWILPAGSQINATAAGKVVYATGDLTVVQIASNVFQEYRHVLTSVSVGQSVSKNTPIGTVNSQYGVPYYSNPGNIREYSTTPHIHVAFTPTLATAINDTSGYDPTLLLTGMAAGGTMAGSSSSNNSAPIIGGLDNAANSAGAGISNAVHSIPVVGPVLDTLGATGNFLNDADAWLGQLVPNIPRYAGMAALGLVALILIAELFKPGIVGNTITTGAKVAAA